MQRATESTSSRPASSVWEEFDWKQLDSDELSFEDCDASNQPYLKKTRVVHSNAVIEPHSNGDYNLTDNTAECTAKPSVASSIGKFKNSVLRPLTVSFTSFTGNRTMYPEVVSDDEEGAIKADDEFALPNRSFSTNEMRKKKKFRSIIATAERRARVPGCIDKFLSFNEPAATLPYDLCSCSAEDKATGVHHQHFYGETPVPKCRPDSNNLSSLYHYVLVQASSPCSPGLEATSIIVDDDCFEFEGFSLFFHAPYSEAFPAESLNELFDGWVFRLVKEQPPTEFTVEELEIFYDYLFEDVLEVYDVNRGPANMDPKLHCPAWHIFPRFVHGDGNGKRKKLLPMKTVLDYLRYQFIPISAESNRVYRKTGTLMTNPTKRPKTLRIDEIQQPRQKGEYPMLVHHATLPTNVITVREDERRKRKRGKERICEVSVSARGYYLTGLRPDFAVHAIHALSMVALFRYRSSLCRFQETVLQYELKEPIRLELALSHPSHRTLAGANVDFCRTVFFNCGYSGSTSKSKRTIKRRGFETLMEAMNVSNLTADQSMPFKNSFNFDNERLEFLGDAAVGLVTTYRLFLMYPQHDEGFLATNRSCLVRNETLSVIADRLKLQEVLLFAHHVDPYNRMDLDHALANALEALMGALFLDDGIDLVDRVYAKYAFLEEPGAYELWINAPPHVLLNDYPAGDRHLIPRFPVLQKLTELEEALGVRFWHIRLLARVFIKRAVGDNFLTKGDNQTLEFLGDSVLQLAITHELYKRYPFHNEGNLSLLRTCLVSNLTQARISDDLGLEDFLIGTEASSSLGGEESRFKEKADLLEAYVGAVFIEYGFLYVSHLINILYLTRLRRFIMLQSWSDPKSLLQQCCLQIATEINIKPTVPHYRVLESTGASNNRRFVIGVYVKTKRLAEGEGITTRDAEMNAASNALLTHSHLFPLSCIAKSLYAIRDDMNFDKVQELIATHSGNAPR